MQLGRWRTLAHHFREDKEELPMIYVSARRCRVRFFKGKRVRFHPLAPQGVSKCPVCFRVVVRGMGKWWEA